MVRSCKRSNADTINSLPDNIIDCILARLPLREAVRTCVISREWRHKWKSVPNLVFDYRFNHLHNHKLESVIYQVLLLHQGSINKFALQVPCYQTSPAIDRWIQLLSSSQIQDFILHLSWGDKYQMTSPFFAFQNLRHLNLYGCKFNPPSQFKGFSKLITLDFQDVDYVPAVFEQFISQSPLLERVRLVGCTNCAAFEFQGPCLRIFTFHGAFKAIRFKNSPVLAEVSLSVPLLNEQGMEQGMHFCTGFKYFHITPTLEKLHLHPAVLQYLDAGSVSCADSLNRLKVLNLTMYLDNIKEVNCAFCLARSSPNLQMLRVTSYATSNVEAIIEFIQAQETPPHYLHQLRRVEIALFSGLDAEIELLRHLLASAAGLEVIVITPERPLLSDDVMNRLKQLPRASPTALICVRKSK